MVEVKGSDGEEERAEESSKESKLMASKLSWRKGEQSTRPVRGWWGVPRLDRNVGWTRLDKVVEEKDDQLLLGRVV